MSTLYDNEPQTEEELTRESFIEQVLEALTATPVGGVTRWEGKGEWDGWKVLTTSAPRQGALTGTETISIAAPTGAVRDLTGMTSWGAVWDALDDLRDEMGMESFLALGQLAAMHGRVLEAEEAARTARRERDQEIRRLVQGGVVLRSEIAQKLGVSNAAVGKIAAAAVVA